MEYSEIKDEDLIELAKLRLLNQNRCYNITKISIFNKGFNELTQQYFANFLIHSISDFTLTIDFVMFYPNEFLFLQKIGVKFNV